MGGLKVKPIDQWTFTEALGAKVRRRRARALSRSLVALALSLTRARSLAARAQEARRRLERHWDSWVTELHIQRLAEAGLTHVRVPIGHWIRGDIAADEPYVNGEWPYLVRAAQWCRTHKMQMWLDLHTAPGSQNGFDNSGRFGEMLWSTDAAYVNRTLAILDDVVAALAAVELGDIVTGFGLLNEPGMGTNYWHLLSFYDRAYAVVRAHLPDCAVYVGDNFQPEAFNWFWSGAAENTGEHGNIGQQQAENAYLDSHIYACFNADLQAMTPREHVKQVCGPELDRLNHCCWEDQKRDVVSKGLGHFVGEWTAAFDQTPSPEFEKQIVKPMTKDRAEFLRQFAVAQMIVYEATPEDHTYMDAAAKHHGLAISGWFFWNFRMESPVYREWDYLEGLRMGWIPVLPANRSTSLKEVFGTCADVLERTVDRCGVVAPHPPIEGWVDRGPDGKPCPGAKPYHAPKPRGSGAGVALALALVALAVCGGAAVACSGRCPALWTPWAKAKGSPGALKRGYVSVPDSIVSQVTTSIQQEEPVTLSA